ncbi:MAG: DUF6440 family protein [Eubacteriales bacterium]
MKKEKRFEIVYKGANGLTSQKILVDKNTGVNYLFVSEGYSGGLTALLDKDGKPVISSVSSLPGEL